MHVAQLLAALSLGGSELVAVELAEYLRARGHRVCVLGANGPLAPRVVAAGAEHIDWPLNRKRPHTLRLVPALRRWLLSERPDVVHVHSRLPAWLLHLALRGMPADRCPRVVASVHGHYSVNRYSAIMTRADRVIAVSDAVREYVRRHYPRLPQQRLVTVPGGCDPMAFPHGYTPPADWRAAALQAFPQLDGRRWLVLPGRLSRYKGQLDFIELIAGLRGAGEAVAGVLVGGARADSRYRRQVDARIRERGLEDAVVLTGARDDMREWLAAAEVVYCLTRKPPEAFGRTVLEALRLGRPVLAWDLGGPQEILQRMFPQGRVAPGDLHALRGKSEALLAEPTQVPPSTAYSLVESMQRTLAVYRNTLAGGR